MTVYLEIAKRLQQDIEVAEAHLAQLNTALAAMKPLITIEMGSSGLSLKALSYSSEVSDVSDAELVSAISADDSASTPPANGSAPAKKRRAQHKNAGAPVVVEQASTKRKAGATDDKLPSTGGTFWMGLMGRRAYTIADIVDRAIAKLELTEEARPVLMNRLSAWLYPSMKAGKVEPGLSKGKLKRYQLTAAE